MMAAGHQENDRALGALLGLAIGDAMGMPSQTLSRARIRATCGRIDGFLDAAPGHPVSAGLAAATVTDDTEQSLLLAAELIRGGGRVDHRRWADALEAWEEETKRRGVHDLLGPSTKRALAALKAGVAPREAGRHGTTNGAAMRITPAAIAAPLEPCACFIDHVEDACLVTHNTSEAIAAAAAVAAMVSAGIGGLPMVEAIPLALAMSRAGAERGEGAGASDVPQRIERALALAASAVGDDELADAVGTSVASRESIPMAFAILRRSGGDAARAAIMAANVGDDTDTIGAMAGAMAGALSGASALPRDMVRKVVAINRLDLAPLAQGLLDIRRARCMPQARAS